MMRTYGCAASVYYRYVLWGIMTCSFLFSGPIALAQRPLVGTISTSHRKEYNNAQQESHHIHQKNNKNSLFPSKESRPLSSRAATATKTNTDQVVAAVPTGVNPYLHSTGKYKKIVPSSLYSSTVPVSDESSTLSSSSPRRPPSSSLSSVFMTGAEERGAALDVSQKERKETWGVLLTDVRLPGPLHDNTAKQMQYFESINFSTSIELWVLPHTDIPSWPTLNVSVRYLSNKTYGKSHISARNNLSAPIHVFPRSHAAKLDAILHSNFDTALFFDSDVAFAPSWVDYVDELLRSHRMTDLFWTLARSVLPQQQQISNNIPFVDVSAFKKLKGRNTGTIFIVRRSGATKRFLQKALDIFLETCNTRTTICHDQTAVLESLFLNRRYIREYLVPETLGCHCEKCDHLTHPFNIDTCSFGACKLVHDSFYFESCVGQVSKEVKAYVKMQREERMELMSGRKHGLEVKQGNYSKGVRHTVIHRGNSTNITVLSLK